jgi:ectoine hydroxylase-related dioxygenase (phytanoyl-CoA dioxygenase family)
MFADFAALPESVVAEAIYLVRSRGYAAVPGFYPASVREQLKSELAAALAAYSPFPGSERSEQDRYHIHDLMNRSHVFSQMTEDPRLQQLLAPLLGESWIMYAFTSSSLPPGGTNYGARLHNDCPRFSPGYIFNVGLIWALDEFGEENGGTQVLPGSQHIEAAPDEQSFNKHCVRVTAPAGALIVFNARLFHRAGENRTSSWRHALTMNVCRSYMKPRMDWVRLIKPEYTANLSPQARRILGFDTRLATTMDEFFLPEQERLYKPGQG